VVEFHRQKHPGTLDNRLPSFTPDIAAALEGPEWLRNRRAAAAERAANRGMPSAEEEVWRYSRIAELDLESYVLAPEAAGSLPEGVQHELDAVADRAATVVVIDGHVTHAEVSDRWAAKGLFAGRLVDAPEGESLLGCVSGSATDIFGELNDAFGADPVLIDIPRGVVLDGPVAIVHLSTGDGTASFPRTVLRAGEDSEASVLEVQSSTGATFSAPVLEVDVGRAARLGLLTVQQLDLASWQLAHQVVEVGADATYRSTTAALGGDYARLRTDCRLSGRGATGDLYAVYFGEGNQMLDFRTFQDHVAPDTTSNLLFKGAVGGHSQSVYTGLIQVEKEARGTNAFQTNRNIKLSDHAWAESVPNLKIFNNDVRCSHASAVGPVDEDQRFYLESRGVPTDVAERLIVTGFFEEVLDALPVGGLTPLLRHAIAGKFDRREDG
jgi:Fe-S cluster assembly protein SufD